MSPSGAPALSTDLLAIIVAVVAFCVSGVFLLILVPGRETGSPHLGSGTDAGQPYAQGGYIATVAPARDSLPVSDDTPGDADFGKGSFGRLGGAGTPPRRFACSLPVERDGAMHFIAVDAVVAVHANAHYTYIFDGAAKLFCALSIGDVESRLDTSRFLRVHRSHIVNLAHVVGLKRSGDGGLVELDGADRYAVPVSRSRVSWLKSRIAAKTGQTVS